MGLPLLGLGAMGAAGLGAGSAAAIPALAAGAGAGLGTAALTGAGGLAAGTALGGAGAGGIAAGTGLGAAGGLGAGTALGAGAGLGAAGAASPAALSAAAPALAAKTAGQVGGTAAGLGGLGANPATAYVPQSVGTKLMAQGVNPTVAKYAGLAGDKLGGMFAKMGENPMQSLGVASKIAGLGQQSGPASMPAPSGGGGVNRALQQAPQDVADDIREQMGMADMGRGGERMMRGMNRRIARGAGMQNARRIG